MSTQLPKKAGSTMNIAGRTLPTATHQIATPAKIAR